MLVAREIEEEACVENEFIDAITQLNESLTNLINNKFDEIMKQIKKE